MRRRLVMVTVAVAALAVVVFAVPLAVVVGHLLRDQAAAGVDRDADALGAQLALGGASTEVVLRRVAGRAGVGVVLVGRAGRVLARQGAAGAPVHRAA